MQNDTCYILALIKRDDGERLLLGTGYYEFTAGQKHFNPNSFANDVVELQGTDGQLLAGQVRRSTTQTFEGYIGDGTISKQMVEQKRREFFLFFRKQHHYTVVYIMPDGTAIKRDRGYIAQAPAVQELYQFQPKWSIGLAFEDVNYYSYAEDSQGDEIYSFEATLALANIADGGLISDANGAKSDAYVHTGKNLYKTGGTTTDHQISYTLDADGTYSIKGTANAQANDIAWLDIADFTDGAIYTFSSTKPLVTGMRILLEVYNGDKWVRHALHSSGDDFLKSGTQTIVGPINLSGGDRLRTVLRIDNGTTIDVSGYGFQLEAGNQKTAFEPYSQGLSNGGYIFAPSTGGGPVVVTVNGVDKASPVWHVYGPATNPTLTNSTTGEALTWNGTVPNNQELIIDMGAQTATLEGANVFEFVSGSWVTLEPGSNRISYTAANTTKSSTVYWNEVVG